MKPKVINDVLYPMGHRNGYDTANAHPERVLYFKVDVYTDLGNDCFERNYYEIGLTQVLKYDDVDDIRKRVDTCVYGQGLLIVQKSLYDLENL